MIKKALNILVLLVGLFLMFGIIFFPSLRPTIGTIVGTILNPILTLLPLHMVIMVLATITGLYASLIQKYTMDWGLTRRIQEKMKNIQKEMRQAQLSNNAAKMKKLQEKQAELVGDQMEMMKQQFKPMLYIAIVSIPLFYWAYLIVTPVYFSWNDTPINDSSSLVTFLEKTQNADWVKNAKIEKSSDGSIITISDGNNTYTLSLNNEKTKVILKTSDKTQEFDTKLDNNKLDVYSPSPAMVFPFWGTQKLDDKFFGPFQFWLFWYFLCSIPVSQMIRKALNIGGM